MVKLVLALNRRAVQNRLEKYLKHGYRPVKEFELEDSCGNKVIGKILPIEIKIDTDVLKGIRVDEVIADDVMDYIHWKLNCIRVEIRFIKTNLEGRDE